jgi:hypothetical protein
MPPSDLDKYMKEIGEDKPIAPTAAAKAPSEPYQGILAPGPVEGLQRGMAKGAAELGVGTARLAGKGIGLISPGAQSKLGQLAEQVPGVQGLEEFADRPYEDPGEVAGSIGMGVMGGAAAERGIASGLANVVDRMTPLARATRGGFVPTTAGKVTKYAAPAAGAVGAGALGGVAGSPQDPVTGAEVGAATGFVPSALGRALRSRAGQYLGGSMARSAAGATLHSVVPGAGLLGHGLRHTVVSYHSPVGQWLQKFGKGLFDTSGKLIGWINPLTGGFVASGTLSAATPTRVPDELSPTASNEEGQ